MSLPPGRYPRRQQREPLDPPDGEVSEAPNAVVVISDIWRSFVVGALEHLTYQTAWRGTDEEINQAVDRVNELIALLMTGGSPGGLGEWTLGSLSDSQLGSTTILG